MKIHPKFILAVTFLVAASRLSAADQTVTSTADSGAGSLRQAIADAASDDIITFDAALSGSTITLAGTHLTIDKNLSIDASSLTDGIVIDGNALSRCFQIDALATAVTFQALTITGGQTANNEFGGGVYNEGTLALQACTIHDCKAGDHGGGIYNTGTLSLTNCTLANNKARNAGSDGNGGGLWSDNDATLISCTLTDNTGYNGGGILIIAASSLTLENTIVSGNTANNQGPDIRNAITGHSGVNFIGKDNGASGLGTLNTDYLKGNAMLAPLGDFGGPTPTAPPLLGSPVLDAGLTETVLATDQRGKPRAIKSIFPHTSNPVPDIGAVELHQFQVQVDSLTDLDDADFSAGNLSLREALNPAYAHSGTIVTFAPSLSGGTITLGSQIELSQEVSIDASTLADRLTLSGNSASRIFNIEPPSGPINVTLQGLQFINGNAPNGGAIYNRLDANTTVINCTFENNTSANGGAIRNRGMLTLLGVTLNNNTADGSPTAQTQGGGIYNNSGGIITMTNCTLTANSTTNNSGGAVFNRGTISIESSTISGNHAPDGGGIRLVEGQITLSNSILAANTITTGSSADCHKTGGTLVLNGANLIGDNASIDIEAPADGTLIGTSVAPVNPLLGSLADNGGPTMTLLPGPSSPAIGAALLPVPGTDQHGIARPLGSTPDLGSVEVDYSIKNPYPVAGAINIHPFVQLTWNPPTINPDRFDLYLNGTYYGSNSLPSFTLALDPNTSYSWRIDTIYGGGAATGEAQSFTTASDAPIVVDTLLDEDDGIGPGSGTSLRDAIASVSLGGRAVITFDPSLDGGTITLAHGQLALGNQQLAIDASHLPSGLTIDANGANRVLSIEHSSAFVFLRSLTLTGGYADSGGAIYSEGTLSIHSSTFSDNSAVGGSSNPAGGAIYSDGKLTIHSSTFSDNSAAGVSPNPAGGAIYSTASLTIHSSTFSDNSAAGNGNSAGGGICSRASLTIHSSTLSDNSAVGSSDSAGGGIFSDGKLTIYSSTFSRNLAEIDHIIIPAVGGGGIYSAGMLSIHSSIVAGNSSSGTNNIFGSYSGSNNFIGGNPKLTPLGDYGGPTQTMALLPGSPAIDAGSSSGVDQRGFNRIIGSAADIGAYEFGNPGVPKFNIYARETIPSGMDDSYSGDPDSDQLPSGLEYAIGTFAGAPDHDSSRLPAITPPDGGGLTFTFGFNPAATIDTTWVVMRTTNLDHSQATEVYRLDGPTMMETTAAGVSAVITADQIIVTDTTPPPGNNVFYYLGAIPQ